jgi:glycosyltransferase involved in cell wall biosynthesis
MKKVCMMLTNPCTNDARVLKEAMTLAGNGYDVRILATMGNNTPKIEHVEGIAIKRIKRKFRSNTLPGKMEFTLKFTFAAVREKADIYHAHDLSTLLECYIASRVNRSKLVYDAHELFADPTKSKVAAFLYSVVERHLIKKADLIITVDNYRSNVLATTYKLKSLPMFLMNVPPLKPFRLGADYAAGVTPEDISRLKKNRRIILHQGTIQAGRGGGMGLVELVESMKYLDDQYYLLMVGDGPLREDLEKMAVEMGVDQRICFTGMVSLTRLPDYTRLADIGAIVYRNTCLDYYYASPNKLFEYIHANVPVLAPDYPLLKEIVEKYDIGVLIDKIEPEEIAAKIKLVFSDKNNYQRMKENTEVAKRNLNWENEEKKLIVAYQALIIKP